MRVQEPPKGILVSLYFTDKKEQNKAKDKYTEIRRSNVVRKPKKKPQGLGHPLFVRLASNRFPGFGSVGRWGEEKSQEI